MTPACQARRTEWSSLSEWARGAVPGGDDEIVQVAEIPRTLTGKKQELPVKKLMLGRKLAEVVNPDACANPAAFDWYVDYAARRAQAT